MRYVFFILSIFAYHGVYWLLLAITDSVWVRIIMFPMVIIFPVLFDGFYFKARAWYDRKTGKVHESGLPMAEWEERQRLKAMDEKLANTHYTDAEKEYLIYTSDLTLENKNLLRYKHIPHQNGK